MYTTPNTNRDRPKISHTARKSQQNNANSDSQKIICSVGSRSRAMRNYEKSYQEQFLSLFRMSMPDTYTKLNTPDQKLKALNTGQKPTNTYAYPNITTNKKDVDEVITQLDQSSLCLACRKFEQHVGTIINALSRKFLSLECKIAECQKKFNAISLQLSMKSKQIRIIQQENRILNSANREIQGKLNKLRKQYDMIIKQQHSYSLKQGIATRNSQNMKKNMDNLHNLISNLNDELNDQSEQHFTDRSYKIKEILHDNLAELVDNAIGESLCNYAHERFLENIELKFKLLYYQQELELPA